MSKYGMSKEAKRELQIVFNRLSDIGMHADCGRIGLAVDSTDALISELAEALAVICNSIETTDNPWRGSSMHSLAKAAREKARVKA